MFLLVLYSVRNLHTCEIWSFRKVYLRGGRFICSNWLISQDFLSYSLHQNKKFLDFWISPRPLYQSTQSILFHQKKSFSLFNIQALCRPLFPFFQPSKKINFLKKSSSVCIRTAKMYNLHPWVSNPPALISFFPAVAGSYNKHPQGMIERDLCWIKIDDWIKFE